MAKPSSETPYFTLSSSPGFGLPSGRRSSGITRKRTRESELIDDIIGYPRKHAKYTCTEDSYKTRRVNPERLALRLDPGLVAEMDALIIPGAKMPTFTVRKDFQERYKVDRRHIYDYFHSRGLRVAKEDKHNNLTRTLSLKARRLPAEETEKRDEQEVTWSDSDNNRGPSVRSLKELEAKSAKRLASAKISVGPVHRRMNPHSQMIHKEPVNTESTQACSQSDVQGDDCQHQSFNPPIAPIPDFTLPEEYPDTPTLVDDTYDPMPDSPSEHLSDFLDSGLWYDYSIDLPWEQGGPDPIMSVDEHRSLTERERIEFYNLIDKSISPPNGVEESSGTYGAYMKERSRFYFDRLFSRGSQGQSKLYHPNQENRLPDVPPEEVGGFLQWLSSPTSQKPVRPVGHFSTEDRKRPVVSNLLQNHDHWQAAGVLEHLKPYTLFNPCPTLDNTTNGNNFDDGIVPSPQHLNTLSYESQFKPAALVPLVVHPKSATQSTGRNGAKLMPCGANFCSVPRASC